MGAGAASAATRRRPARSSAGSPSRTAASATGSARSTPGSTASGSETDCTTGRGARRAGRIRPARLRVSAEGSGPLRRSLVPSCWPRQSQQRRPRRRRMRERAWMRGSPRCRSRCAPACSTGGPSPESSMSARAPRSRSSSGGSASQLDGIFGPQNAPACSRTARRCSAAASSRSVPRATTLPCSASSSRSTASPRALLERVHAANCTRSVSVPALRRTADDSDGGPAYGSRASCPVPVSPLRLSWPVATSITSGYGLRGARFHGGVDIVAGLGTPVGSPGSGEVSTPVGATAAGATRSSSPTAAGCARSWRISRASTSTSATACAPAPSSGSPEHRWRRRRRPFAAAAAANR